MLFPCFSQNTVTVKITNVNYSKKGQLRIAVFNENGFLNNNKVYDGKVIAANKNQIEVVFSLPDGVFAIAVIHDIDENKKLSTNIVGYPTEPYAFSNNKYGVMGPPNFKDVSFKASVTKTLTINL